MGANKTSLSAGIIIRAILQEAIGDKATAIFPVVADTATLPYIQYRRVAMQQNLTKGRPAADEAQIEVNCYAGTYAGSIELAEEVRAALDGMRSEYGGMVMRSCYLADAEEYYDEEAFIQRLTFNVKI